MLGAAVTRPAAGWVRHRPAGRGPPPRSLRCRAAEAAQDREALLNECAALATSLHAALTSPEFKAKHVRGARAFYDGQHGLRIIVVTPNFWGEAWVHGPATRRASMHTLSLEKGIVYQYDTATRAMTVLKNEGWPDDMLGFVFDL